jgi:hypothetical protein
MYLDSDQGGDSQRCSSKVILSGVNSDVIMSGHGKTHSPDNEGAEAGRSHPESL